MYSPYVLLTNDNKTFLSLTAVDIWLMVPGNHRPILQVANLYLFTHSSPTAVRRLFVAVNHSLHALVLLFTDQTHPRRRTTLVYGRRPMISISTAVYSLTPIVIHLFVVDAFIRESSYLLLLEGYYMLKCQEEGGKLSSLSSGRAHFIRVSFYY